jgi:tRNA(Ile)-lysidine synthase
MIESLAADEAAARAALRSAVECCRAGTSYVAFSGGPDSLALAIVAAEEGAAVGVDVRLVHVNHQLQPAANDWAARAIAIADTLGLPIDVVRVAVAGAGGRGLEAAARDARYQAFRDLVDASDQVLTAHHLGDQAETVLLRLLRGVGVEGLSAMMPVSYTHGLRLGRPWLEVDPECLGAIVTRSGIEPIIDPSNAETGRFDRAYLRHTVVPLLQARWPQALATIGRSATLHREAATLLDEHTAELKRRCLSLVGDGLSRHTLGTLSEPAARRVLRHWFTEVGARAPSLAMAVEISRQLRQQGSELEIRWDGHVLRSYRDTLFFAREIASDLSLPRAWNPSAENPLLLSHGLLHARACVGGGLKQSVSASVQVDYRQPGERVAVRTDENVVRHQPLKKLMQTLGISPWVRAHLPLLRIGAEVAVIPGFRTVPQWAAGPGEYGWMIEWEPRG